jgi:hypothetical protein
MSVYRNQVLAKAIEHLEAAKFLLTKEAEREARMHGPGPDWGMVGTLRSFSDQIGETLSCDHGQAGLKPWAASLADKAVRS